MIKNIKERFVSLSGSITGIGSVVGSWQICHNICLAIITVLGLIGISIVGMPLAFITTYAVYLWSAAAALLAISFSLYIIKKCISKRMLMFNSGLIIAGVPFQPVQQYSSLFLTVGISITVISILLYISDRRKKSCCKE